MGINEKSVHGNAVVIGAGTMGGGIAAQLANAGWTVKLLDVAGLDSADDKARNQAALAGLERVKKNRPPLLFLPEFAQRIQVGNTEDNLDWLGNADWIVEAVAENLPIKQAVLAHLEAHAGPDTIISSNTSGLGLAEMTAGRSPDFKRRFLGTHFLNPPRYLKLLELILLPETDRQRASGFSAFAERVLGHRVVIARDTPGFISTRIGIWHLLDSIHFSLEHNLTVEETDYLTGPLIGRPRTGTFRLADLVGFDILAAISHNQYERLPRDPYRHRYLLPEIVPALLTEGRTGEKSGGGFYKREGREQLALDLTTRTYRPRISVTIPEVEALLKLPLSARFKAIPRSSNAPWARFLIALLDALEQYARYVGPEIADDVQAIDHVMQWGFHWELGPFEIADLRQNPESNTPPAYTGTGADRKVFHFSRNSLIASPPHPEYLSLQECKAAGKTVLSAPEATLIDLEDGVVCLEFHTKMNTFNPALSAFVEQSRLRAERDFVALVIGNQAPNFSAGYNLSLFLEAITANNWPGIDQMLRAVQTAFLGLKYASIPVVAAPHGYTLGAGCECVLHCAAVLAAPELAMGLPEVNVGVVPAGGGAKERLMRAMASTTPDSDPFPHIEGVFDLLAFPRNSTNAEDARQLGFLHNTDLIARNADRQLYEAKELALALANADYRPPVIQSIKVLGEETLARLRMKIHGLHRSGAFTDYDRFLADQIAYLLSGGNLPHAQEVTEEYLLHLEREVFLTLAHEPKSAARMRHVLETGKPLKN